MDASFRAHPLCVSSQGWLWFVTSAGRTLHVTSVTDMSFLCGGEAESYPWSPDSNSQPNSQ